MAQTSGMPVEWLPPGGGVQLLSITIEAAEPSPDARICYTATSGRPA